VGPFRLPKKLTEYANGASGLGGVAPNAQTMAYDAAVAANPTVNFTPYDNDGNGYVDAFIVIHAGTGAETNANPNDIWSHKWTLAGGAYSADATKIYAYLTVPEDCRIGVCAHELGHLLFGFPDLYDTDNSSEGIGNWCLMAAGSWGGGGNAPVHPSAWCKANQGWVAVENRTVNGVVQIADVKGSHKLYRLWKDGGPGKEYFLVENRQATGDFDKSMPGSGLLIWHVDENQTSNRDENHYWVALMQADGKRDMENNANRGDAGDCWPGSTSNSNFTNTSTPNSKSYVGQATCVAVTGISAPGATMSANLQVKCTVKRPKEFVKDKEFAKELRPDKSPVIEKRYIPEKRLDTEKFPDKTWVEIPGGKLTEGRPWTRGGQGAGGGGITPIVQQLLARISALEEALSPSGEAAEGQGGGGRGGEEAFIGSDLRPDLSQGAYQHEEDHGQLQELMNSAAPGAKRLFDTSRT
jgi:immune inhibitor A